MPQRTCSVQGCAKPVSARGWCSMHYSRWKKHGDPLIVKHRHDGHVDKGCSTEGCDRKHYSRGLCKTHYNQQPDQRANQQRYDKRADVLKAKRERDHQRRADPKRRAYKNAYDRAWQDAHKDWAAWWERQRRREDRAELRTWKPKVWPHCRLDRRPAVRLFTAGYCQACGEPWVYYAKRAQSPYCAPCAAIRRSRPGTWRAKRAGAKTEPIIPRKVFERDQWRCQICKRKTRGQVPALLAPTLDHIIPLARGGSHTYDNLQCACYRCNCHVKRDGAANEQLLLIG